MDYFAVLELPRQPWLDANLVKASFQRLAAAAHPDAGGSPGAFTDLNTAWQTLRDPVTRLRHFLELEQPALLTVARETPRELGDLFMDIAEARQATQQHTARREAALSPLSRALLEPERLALAARLGKVSTQVTERLTALEGQLKHEPGNFSLLAHCLGSMTYLSKWDSELRELSMVAAP